MIQKYILPRSESQKVVPPMSANIRSTVGDSAGGSVEVELERSRLSAVSLMFSAPAGGAINGK
jgi:hypothetical protein